MIYAWDIEVWKKIKDAFPDKKNSSRIIITTRDKEVAQGVDGRCFVHELNFLSEGESWQLFCKQANVPGNLERLGKEMVAKCKGLPLAIVVLSGLLVDKSYEDWSEVKDNLWMRLKGKSTEIQEILNLSYDYLSSQTKECFLYLARFPEDHNFNVDKLMRLWIAEKFVLESISDIAKYHWHGEVKECLVHHLVRDLALRKSSESNLLGVFDSSKQHTAPIHLLRGIPRHAIHHGIGEYLKLHGPSSDNFNLHSLALFSNSERFLELEEMKLICARFKYLKVLDLNIVKSDMIPQEIGNLVFLQFLGLTRSHKYRISLPIPPSIGTLKRLQTLCGADDSKYIFPKEISELKELTHIDRFSRGTGTLNLGSHQTKLQTLRSIEYSEWTKIHTVNLTNLHSLIIPIYGSEEEGNVKCRLDSIAYLTSLQSLFIGFFTFPSDNNTLGILTMEPLLSCKRLTNVYISCKINAPSELIFLPDSVTKLRLKWSVFTQDPMPTLGSLSNLTSLILDKVYSGQKMVCSNDAFPSLQLFYLRNMPDLEEWQIKDGALCSLKTF